MPDTLSPEFVESYRKLTPPWGYNGLGYAVYKSKYSRLKPDGSQEEWFETVARCVNGAQKIGAEYTKAEAERLYDHVFNLRCNFAGRMLWQLGTGVVERLAANALLNCFYVSITKPDDFCFVFENLMMGAGVGFSVRREDVHELPKIKAGVKITHLNVKDADFIVPDSRGGWVSLMRKVLDSWFVTGKSFSYSTILVRSAGESIKGFGGTASGPVILVDGIEKINKVMAGRQGKKLRSVDVLDICNIAGSIVVAGNVRRSAEIALGDPDDILFLRAKRWDLGGIPSERAMSNNTIYADSFDHIMNEVWEGYAGNGEPYGFFNLQLSQTYGRLKDGKLKKNDNCEGTNPCGEISLASYESCNLSELYLNNIESQKQLIDCAKLLYKTQKAVAALPFLHDETNKIVRKNMRLGLGVTGICQSMHKIEWLDECYEELRRFDKEWSKKMDWPESIKLTTTKPSGTLSLLAGSTPGVHPGYSAFYIRRVRMGSGDKLVSLWRDHGYNVEFAKNQDGTLKHDTVVVEFPCQSGKDAVLAKNMPAVKQLELVRQIQTIWSDNAVSVTVYYKPEELPGIKEWLKKNYRDSIKSVSFLLHSQHGFVQAPYEEIDEARFNEMTSKIKPIKAGEAVADDSLESMECAGGACPIK